MATKIEKYNDARFERTNCLVWFEMVGAKYSDGAKNYHQMPASLTPHLEAAIKARFEELVIDALDRQDLELKAAAAEAVKEHGELIHASLAA